MRTFFYSCILSMFFIVHCKSMFLILCPAGRVCAPKQLVIKKDPTSIPFEVAKAGLRLPLGIFFCAHIYVW